MFTVLSGVWFGGGQAYEATAQAAAAGGAAAVAARSAGLLGGGAAGALEARLGRVVAELAVIVMADMIA